jgi:hypothetical protein
MSRGQSLDNLGQWSQPPALGVLDRHSFYAVDPLLSVVAALAYRRTGRERAKDVHGLTGVPGRDEWAPRCSSYVFIPLG